MRILLIVTFAVAILTTSISCTKQGSGTDDASSSNTYSNKLNGSWEYRQAVGGFCGTCVFDYPAGNGQIIKYSGKAYEMYNKGQLIQSGEFNIMKDSSTFFHTMGYRIVYDNDLTGAKVFIAISDDKLSFTPEVYDYQVAIYQRVSGN